jgi:acyl carrier protein
MYVSLEEEKRAATIKLENLAENLLTDSSSDHPSSQSTERDLLGEIGGDSLTSVRFLNRLQAGLGNSISMNVWQSVTSIGDLADFLVSADALGIAAYQEKNSLASEDLRNFGKKDWQIDSRSFSDTSHLNSSDIVLLTGGTGFLGCFILYELLSRPECKTVYCIVRSRDHEDGLNRIKSTFIKRRSTSFCPTSS